MFAVLKNGFFYLSHGFYNYLTAYRRPVIFKDSQSNFSWTKYNCIDTVTLIAPYAWTYNAPGLTLSAYIGYGLTTGVFTLTDTTSQNNLVLPHASTNNYYYEMMDDYLYKDCNIPVELYDNKLYTYVLGASTLNINMPMTKCDGTSIITAITATLASGGALPAGKITWTSAT